MPRYVTNKVVLQEVDYQFDKGLSGVLHIRKKAPWPTFPLRIGLYELKIHKAEITEIQEMHRLHFVVKDIHRFDPRRVCKQHCDNISFAWVYSSISTIEDEKMKML